MSTFIPERQYHVLLVEDDPVNIGVIVNSIGSRYQLYIAKTRAKALEVLLQTKIDLLLLDIGLPDGNGFDICREVIESKHLFGDVHIMFMTGMDNPEDEARGINLGAHDYITKPINSTVLKARVNLQIQSIRQTELLSNLARIDGTTEVNNRRAFDDQLQNEWNRALRERKPLSLCLLDIDFFKRFNDTYGHPAGDDCLRQLAACLKNRFKRATDFVARYGGEEFAIILYKTDQLTAVRLVRSTLGEFVNVGIAHEQSDVSKFTTFSAGVCTTIPSSNASFNTLLEEADKQLYLAKEQGRAQVVGASI